MNNTQLQKQLAFIAEADNLKSVVRRNYLLDGSRFEDTAEHSWHAALAAWVFKDFANDPIDIDKVIKMLLIHDVVEIEAGDTCLFYAEEVEDQAERELKAAEHLFGILPETQGGELKNLWLEFEARNTPEARYAKAIDRFMPMWSNYESGGKAWVDGDVKAARLREINEIIKDGSEALYQIVAEMVDDAIKRGLCT